MIDRKVLKSRAKFVLARTLFPSIVACAAVSLVSELWVSFFPRIMPGANAGWSDLRLLAIYGIMALMILVMIGVYIFISGPLKVGLKNFMLRAADMDAKVENIVIPFKVNYKSILRVTFVKNLYIFLWSLLGLIPFVLSYTCFGMGEKLQKIIATLRAGESLAASFEFLAILTVLLLFVAVFSIPAFIKELQYSMVEYILAENPYGKVSDILRKSKEMMVGHKWEYVKLYFSFFGWAIVASAFCCGIGVLILEPYIEATYAQMYLEISGQGKDYSFYDFQNPIDGFGRM